MCLVPNPHYTNFGMKNEWWVDQPQGEEYRRDVEGRVVTRGRTYTEGKGGKRRGEEGGKRGGVGDGEGTGGGGAHVY